MASIVAALVPVAGVVAAEGGSSGTPRRVRVTAPGVLEERVVGEIVSADDETITVRAQRTGRTYEIPAEAVTRVELRRKTGARGRAIKIGALAGLAIGAVAGYAAGDDCGAADAPSLVCFPRGGTALVLGLAGSLVGAGVGAVVAPSERWELVRVRSLTAGVVAPSARRREVGVFVSASF
jgi:hypothetical protein